MNQIKTIQRINETELEQGILNPERSWHNEYKDQAYIFIGGLNRELTEGDILTVFSQYGVPVDILLVRDKETHESKGFAYLKYEDQRSTILAVDNLNGIKLAGRLIKVDHIYFKPRDDIPEYTLAIRDELDTDKVPEDKLQIVSKGKPDQEFDEELLDPIGSYKSKKV
ncbi:U2 snRNP complex subunit IST3 RNJ42_04946 [Nakaseomyces bracarensis]|uniref:U2 snRNP complex subunit IST3 n=1 Tax=Nakaseomyces bracarensis TaxID=273131 RepID=UPI00387112DE